jgi:LacI family transcriptional regulator
LPAAKPLKKLPTLADVAKRAAVSTATVSRCLNEPLRVEEATRSRVLKAVQDLGYSPNFGARALAAKRTNTVGAVIPTMDNAIFARALQAFEEELNARGFTLLVASSSYDTAREAEQLRTLVARGADALLLIGFDRDAQIYDFLDGRGVPYLTAWVHDETGARPSIGFNNKAAAQDLAQAVLALGHRQLAYISAPCADNDRARARVDGTRAALLDAGIDPATLPVIETPYSVDNGKAALKALMKGPTPPTAVLCGNDVLAVGAVKAAKDLGLRVPQDLSITGFDDIELANLSEPALTTVHVPHRQMGRRAAEILVQMITADEKPNQIDPLETYIVMRDTLAAPKG